MTAVSVHGVHDTLADVFDWTIVTRDPDFDNASSFHSEVAQFTAVRDRLAATGRIPAVSQVVDVHSPDWCDHYFDAYGACADPTLADPATGRPGWPGCCPDNGAWTIEVLHNDGRRTTVTSTTNPFEGAGAADHD